MFVHDVSKSHSSLTPMLKIVFSGELHPGPPRYEDLAKCWMAALTQRKKEAVHMLALAQRDIEKLENHWARTCTVLSQGVLQR